MERARFWIDFDNGDICREDGVAIASLLAPHCEHTPEELQELAAILDAHAKYPNCIPIGESRVVELEEKEAKYDRLRERVRILREACEDARKELEAQATYFGPHLDPENNLFRILRKLESVIEATEEA